MNNPTRRNRNIGTAKQGFKKRNAFDIPDCYPRTGKIFWENLSQCSTVKRRINGYGFTFVVEKTKENYYHACTIDDLEIVLQAVPSFYFQGLRTIILRQPKRKEEFFSNVWRRLVFGFEFQKQVIPAIILESVKKTDRYVLPKKLSLEQQAELKRLKNDGHTIVETKREYVINLTLESARNTLLYRTLLHEIGHHYHNSLDEEVFDKLPSVEKETFAHNFADKLKAELEEKRIIPFPRIFNEKNILNNNLDLNDFQCESSSQIRQSAF